ncbi:MAG: SET domain-containing protein-lysine N-methyltransferase [Verrucomicrobia bacterium]|nr:SET domain-containing protein-lysine N-methyltransferase [Verrucomicrobiota bacterium]
MPKIKHNDHPLVVAKKSKIHGYGCYARTDIKKGKRVMEYVGPLITKKEAAKALDAQNEYIFTLNDKFDIDGSVDYNIARYINHSCDPNCESDIKNDRVWLYTIRDVKEGEELTYNYGYDLEDFEYRTCKCGTTNCIGYMVAEDDFDKVRAMTDLADMAEKKKKRKPKKKKSK